MIQPKVLISDKMDPKAAAIFRERGIHVDEITGQAPDALKAIIGDYDGLAIRSATKVTADLLAALHRLGQLQPALRRRQRVVQAAEPWRSSLYPKDWRPGYADAQGRFLHDFSYAGYHRGERALPDVAGPVFDVTAAPYGADASGAKCSANNGAASRFSLPIRNEFSKAAGLWTSTVTTASRRAR